MDFLQRQAILKAKCDEALHTYTGKDGLTIEVEKHSEALLKIDRANAIAEKTASIIATTQLAVDAVARKQEEVERATLDTLLKFEETLVSALNQLTLARTIVAEHDEALIFVLHQRRVEQRAEYLAQRHHASKVCLQYANKLKRSAPCAASPRRYMTKNTRPPVNMFAR